MKTTTIAGLMIGVCAVAASADAQTAWTDRAYINAGATYRATSTTFSDIVHPTDFLEAADVTTVYPVKAAPGFDVGGGVRIWRNLAIGVAVARTSKAGTGSVSAQIPHPLYFNQPRSVSGDAPALAREETGIHLQALWMVPMGPRWQLSLFGGPSFYNVTQDLVSDVTFTQAYPFDTAAYTGAVTHSSTRSAAGFNAGADVTRMLAAHVGLGASVSFSQARVSLPSTGSDIVKVDAGGAHVGGGIRFRF